MKDKIISIKVAYEHAGEHTIPLESVSVELQNTCLLLWRYSEESLAKLEAHLLEIYISEDNFYSNLLKGMLEIMKDTESETEIYSKPIKLLIDSIMKDEESLKSYLVYLRNYERNVIQNGIDDSIGRANLATLIKRRQE